MGEHKARKEIILDLLLAGELTAPELAEALDITPFAAATQLSRFYQKGIVIRHRNNNIKYPKFVYRLNRDGLKAKLQEELKKLA